ncbi:MAG TPA: 3-phosphoshikimate 1-carboxyvinyltransferase, partial [Vicinamibacterales bacterium]|nr:3-phosphoshikimate 1-carboxyvinyltransferase [Vicinamibacterales bacterium]
TRIDCYSTGADCLSTLTCLEALGVRIQRSYDGDGLSLSITGRPQGFAAPAHDLDCGNSGTTMRLLSGLLASQPFTATLVGDASLTGRPMHRVMAPLSEMGARFEAGEGGRPPLCVTGGRLTGITHRPEAPSAQIKSAVLLAGLRAEGKTVVIEPAATRDHTERALVAFGVAVDRTSPGRLGVSGGALLAGGLDLRVPGDPSATAFLAVAAAGLDGSALDIDEVGLNPTRTALFDVLRRAGAVVTTHETGVRHGEPVGRVHVATGSREAIVITPAEVPLLIDELPALAALATFGGSIEVRGAGELRVKESDRITALVDGLRAMGADAEEHPDGFAVRGTRQLRGGMVDARHDHRLAMSFAVAALGAEGPTHISGAEVAAVSFPGFFETLERLRT